MRVISMSAQLVKAAMRIRFGAPPREFWAVLDAYKRGGQPWRGSR